jgi:hypothetical protein
MNITQKTNRLISIENSIYKLSASDFKKFKIMLQNKFRDENKHYEALKFVIKNYEPIAILEASYNF